MLLNGTFNKVAIAVTVSDDNGVPYIINFDYGYEDTKSYRLSEDYPYRVEG